MAFRIDCLIFQAPEIRKHCSSPRSPTSCKIGEPGKILGYEKKVSEQEIDALVAQVRGLKKLRE